MTSQPPQQPLLATGSYGGIGSSMLVVAVVVPVMTALLLLALLLLVKSHWVPVLGAKVQPLGLGPDTTFLITDIQVRL